MAVVEIRIKDIVDLTVIEAGQSAGTAGASMHDWLALGESDRQVVILRAARPAAAASPRATAGPRRTTVALDYAGWHARLAGDTRTA